MHLAFAIPTFDSQRASAPTCLPMHLRSGLTIKAITRRAEVQLSHDDYNFRDNLAWDIRRGPKKLNAESLVKQATTGGCIHISVAANGRGTFTRTRSAT